MIFLSQALEEMAAKNDGIVTCPRTGKSCAFQLLRKVFISWNLFLQLEPLPPLLVVYCVKPLYKIKHRQCILFTTPSTTGLPADKSERSIILVPLYRVTSLLPQQTQQIHHDSPFFQSAPIITIYKGDHSGRSGRRRWGKFERFPERGFKSHRTATSIARWFTPQMGCIEYQEQ